MFMACNRYCCYSSSVSPIGSVPSSPPSNPLYKFTTANKGEPFYFAVTRLVCVSELLVCACVHVCM